MRQSIANNVKNIPGRRFKDKLLIIECDDWGSIRMPSQEIYNTLRQKKIKTSGGHFDKFDTIEDSKDLEYLFELLHGIKDVAGNSAVMTPFVNVANPWFEKIADTNYEQYIYEYYTQTLDRYGRDKRIVQLWKQGIELNIFPPEFHGREHLTVPIWLKELRNGNKELRLAFEYGFTSVELSHLHPLVQGFRAEFFFDDDNQKEFLSESISDGINIFKKQFNYSPNSFIPGNMVFHPDFEEDLIINNISYLNVDRHFAIPDGKGDASFQKNHYSKFKSKGLSRYMRNCAFEPCAPGYSNIDNTLNQIRSAFRWSKPAIISTHRVNYVGSISENNRTKGLNELGILLTSVLRIWPDVKFMSTNDFINSIRE